VNSDRLQPLALLTPIFNQFMINFWTYLTSFQPCLANFQSFSTIFQLFYNHLFNAIFNVTAHLRWE
jgi:hypothetical protein